MSIRSVIFWVGLDVHKDSITAAVFRGRDPEPLRVDRIPNDPKRIRRYFERLQRDGEARVCYEASGAGYVLQRRFLEWGIPCELAAPSLIPRRAGEHRKTDRRDAIKIARDFRDDRLVLIHIPTEEEERVRDLVRCRETFQREILKSRHYILKFLRRRGFIYREGTHWTTRHINWIRQVLKPGDLAEEDRDRARGISRATGIQAPASRRSGSEDRSPGPHASHGAEIVKSSIVERGFGTYRSLGTRGPLSSVPGDAGRSIRDVGASLAPDHLPSVSALCRAEHLKLHALRSARRALDGAPSRYRCGLWPYPGVTRATRTSIQCLSLRPEVRFHPLLRTAPSGISP
jgi:hypothetical protein